MTKTAAVDLLSASPEQIAEAVRQMEDVYSARVESASRALTANGKLKYLLLAGPTCSGKTTTAGKLAVCMERLGRRVRVISIDDFYKKHDELMPAEDGSIDFESVRAIDLPEISRVVEALQRGEPARIPHYDFNSHDRSSYTTLLPENGDLFLFEGIQAVYPEIIRLFPADATGSLFVTVDSELEVSGVRLEKETLRLIRRIVRDSRFRSASPEFTLSIWETVRNNEIRHILPNAEKMDIVIDTLLPYEGYVLARELVPLLDSVEKTNPFAPRLQALADRVRPLLAFCGGEEIVPKDSMLREFIG